MSDRLELHHVEHVLRALNQRGAPDDALVLAGGLAVAATIIKQRDAAERALDLVHEGALTCTAGLWMARGDDRVFSNWIDARDAFDFPEKKS